MIRLSILPGLVVLVVKVPAILSDVTWDSPSIGDVYTPGDTLQAVWTSSDKVISPSFTICTANNSIDTPDGADCGTAVWPYVAQNGTEYSISLTVPNITGNGNYFLVMKDDQGTTYDTPNFSLAASNTPPSASATSSSSTTEPTATSVNYLPSHSEPSIVAVAIPLSLVAATLLVALLLLLCRLRRSRQRERDKEKGTRASEKVGSEQSAISFASATDIERAVLSLAAARDYGARGPPHPAPGMAAGVPFGAQGLAAVAAAALGMGAFGWAHGYGQQPLHVAPGIPNAYAPEQYAANAGAGSVSQPGTSRVAPVSPLSQSPLQSTRYHDHNAVPRPDHWRGTEQAFANVSSTPSQPPKLPAIQVLASSPPLQSIPPPVPPKQLLPGSPLSHTPRPYEPPYSSPPKSIEEASPGFGANAHASLNVISNYMQASPALSQGNTPPQLIVQSPRLPPSGITRMRSLRRLETNAECEKQLPTRPEDRIGTDLYDAVSKAVGR